MHGYYSKFLTPEEAEDFANFQAHFSLDVDVAFLRSFVAKVMEYVTDPQARHDLLAYLKEHLGATAL